MAGRNRARLLTLATGSAPWLAFLALLLAGWRVANLTGALPAYGDVLEVVWTTVWYDGALRGLHGFLVYPSIFFPVGWHVATFAGGPAMFLLLLPLDWLGGPAFAYNVTTLLTFALAFAGTNRLARRFLGALPAAVAALLFTFWGFRWFRIAGHLNISLASALLPWLALSIDRALDAERRKVVCWAVAGALWAAMIACSWYFVWMGGILLFAWVGGRWLADRALGRAAVAGLLISTAVALTISSPWLILFLRESSAVGASFYSIEEVSFWSASLNSLPIPSVTHPWLQGLAHALYTGPVNEPGQANLGVLVCLLALAGLRPAARDRRWWPLLMLAAAGLVLTLGLTLKWNGQPVHMDALRPLNDLIWQVGHRLKPDFFATARPTDPFATAVPLPGLLLSVFVPFWERARVFARYALLLGMSTFLLAGLGLSRLRSGWARALVAGLLLLEVLPVPAQSVPFPPPSHPAFDWLKEQQLGDGAILDLGSWQETFAYIPISGNALWATEYHKQSALAGASSVWPPHIVFLDSWLSSHPHPFQNPDFIPLLRFYGVRLVVLHVTGGYAEDMLAEARQNPELAGMRCFNPLNDLGPWNYPICVAQLTPPARPAFNILRQDGWSGTEEWGYWVEGTEARANWAAPMRKSARLAVDIFPICVPGRPQGVTIEVNGKILTTHQWQNCEPWQSEVMIPEDLIQVGWNDIVLRSTYAARPVDFTGGQNADSRLLSVGVRQLEVSPVTVP